jgi:hypothetical protein
VSSSAHITTEALCHSYCCRSVKLFDFSRLSAPVRASGPPSSSAAATASAAAAAVRGQEEEDGGDGPGGGGGGGGGEDGIGRGGGAGREDRVGGAIREVVGGGGGGGGGHAVEGGGGRGVRASEDEGEWLPMQVMEVPGRSVAHVSAYLRTSQTHALNHSLKEAVGIVDKQVGEGGGGRGGDVSRGGVGKVGDWGGGQRGLQVGWGGGGVTLLGGGGGDREAMDTSRLWSDHLSALFPSLEDD